MKKLIQIALCLSGFLVHHFSTAQSINNYGFSTGSNASLVRTHGSLIDDIDMTVGSTILIGGSNNNTNSTLQNIGFDFFINGTRQTQFNVTSTGWVGIGTTATTALGWITTTGVKLAPFLGSNTSTIGTSAIGRVHSKLVGSYPTRVLVIEFLNMAINSSVLFDTTTFQVRLYESSGEIEYVYGRTRVSFGPPVSFNVGFQLSTTVYTSVDVTSHTATVNSTTTNTFSTVGNIPTLNSIADGSRRYYRWIPTPPNDPSNMTFNFISSNAMGINWTDASNETAYALYKSVDNGNTYSFVSMLAANSVFSYQTGLPAGTDIYWRLYSVREALGSPLDGVGTTLPASKNTSIASGNWNDPTIWSSGNVPVATDSVEIAAAHTVNINITFAACGSLEVKGTLQYAAASQGILTVNGDVHVATGGSFTAGIGVLTTHTLTLGGSATSALSGSLVVDGIFDMVTTASCNVSFVGNQDAVLSGSGATCDFANLTVNKGTTQAAVLDVQRVITMAVPATTQRLTVNAGTFKLSSASTITPYLAGVSPTICAANGRLWLNHASASINTPAGTGTNAPNLNGELRIDNGTMTVGNGSNTLLIFSGGTLRMNGGTLNVLGGLATASATQCSLIVAGGTIAIDPQASVNLSTASQALNIQPLTTVDWSGGTISIVDPHATAGVNAVSISAGGTKSITGGLLQIGNGSSTTSGGAASNTAGFGINSQMDFYNVEINNNISAASSRMARLTSNIRVLNQLEIKPNAYLFMGTGTNGFTLDVQGNVINNGVLAGTEPSGTQGIGTLQLDGAAAQTLSGSGTTANANILLVKNTSGVSFTNSNNWAFTRVNLQGGTITTGSNFTVGNASFAPVIQVGGVDESTIAGAFSSVPAFNTTAGNPTYIYGPTSSTLTTGAFSEMAAGAQTLAGLTLNDADGLTANRAITTLNLTMSGGNLVMGANNLSIGTSATAVGVLNRTSGFVSLTTGTFKRWYATGTTPSQNYNSGFPIVSPNGNERTMMFSTSQVLASGGSISVQHSDVSGYSAVSPSFVDGGITIDRRSNSNWTLSQSGINLGTGFISIRMIAKGIGAVSTVSNLRCIRANDAVGTSLSGSGSTPEIDRNFSQANLTAGLFNNTFYVGSNSLDNPLTPVYTAVANGAWTDPTTWDANAVPGSGNNVIIGSPYTVTHASGFANGSDVTISSGGALTVSGGSLNVAGSITLNGTLTQSNGTLNVTGANSLGLDIGTGATASLSGGTLTIGPSGGGNRTLNVSGTLSVSSAATLKVNGNFNVSSVGTFNQTGGNVLVDGNSGTAATSVAQGTHLVTFNSSNLDCSAGTFTIVDPPHNSYTASSTQALRISASASLTAFTGTHTFKFGDGVSNETGNTNGFNVDTRRSGVVPLQNVIVSGGSANGRWTSASFSAGTFGMHVKGTFTINSGSEFRHLTACQLALGGDIVNNGTMTTGQSMTLGGIGYSVTNSQSISGTGTFRNATSSPTAAFTSVTVASGGLSFTSTGKTFDFSGTFTIGSLVVDAGSNTIYFPSTGSLSRTSGYIIGAMGKYFSTGSNVSRTFEIGNAANYMPVTITFPSVTTAGPMYVNGMPATDDPQIASSCFTSNLTINRYWDLSASGIAPMNYNISLTYLSGDADPGITLGNVRSQVYSGSAWTGNVSASATSTSATINGLAAAGHLQLGEFAPFPVSVSISTAATTVCSGTSVQFTATPVNGGTSPTYQWKKNGSNVGTSSSTYTDNTLVTGDQVSCSIVSSSPCALLPNASSNVITMTVNQPSVGGSVSGGSTICEGSASGTLTLSGNTGNVVNWESAVSPFTTWTTIANTASTYTSGALSQTTRFRAVVQNGVCASMSSSSTTVNVDPASVGGSVTGALAVCSGSTSGTLSLSGHTGNVVRWESAVAPFTTWTTISNTSTTYTSGALTQTTQFRAVVQSGVCSSANSSPVTVTVDAPSVGGSVAGGSSICSGATSGTLTLSGHTGNVVSWESSVAPFTTWTTISNTSATYTSGALTQTTQFRAVVQNGSCASATSSPTTVTVTPGSVGGSVTGGSTICSGSTSGTLTLSGHTGNIVNWESAVAPFTTWTTIANTSTTYTSGALTQTTQFRALVQSGSCATATSSATTVTVNPTSVGGSVAGGSTICSGATSGTLTLSGHTGNVVSWESSVAPFTTWTTIANTSTTYTSGALTQTTQFRAVVQSGSCATATSSATTVTVNPGSAGGSVSGGSSICSGSTSGTLTLSGHTGNVVNWESAVAPFTTWTTISNTSNTYTSGALTQTTQFRAVVQSGSCVSATSSAATVTVNAATVAGTVSGSTPVCTGTSSSLTLSGNTGNVVNWESAVSPFTTWNTISSTSTTLSTSAITQSTQFRAVVQSGGCASATTSPFTVNVIASGVWLGTTSSNWNDPANWCGGVPNATVNVTINAGTPNAPVINVPALVNDLTLGSGASLSFSGTTNSLDIRGNVTYNGTLNTSNGLVLFGGASAQTIPAITYDDLGLQGSNKSLAGNITVNKTLTFSSGKLQLGAYNVTIGASAAILSASASGYIVTNGTGRLIQQSLGTGGRTGAIEFPVGTSASYTPAAINNAGTADDFGVRVIDSVYASGQPVGNAYTTDAVAKTWFIDEAVAGGSNASLTLQWNATDELSGFARNTSKVCMWTGNLGGPWNWGPVGAASGSGPYTQTLNGVSTFSSSNPFAVGSNLTPLPVRFLSLDAQLQSNVPVLSWKTASELNNDHFDIERSLDGRSFEKAGEQQGAGNSSEVRSYSFSDRKAPASADMLYYRIRQVDFNGKFSYSNTVSVSRKGAGSFGIASVSPNPFNQAFTLQYTMPGAAGVSLEITDMFGKTVHSTRLDAVKGLNSFTLPADAQLSSGVYFVRLVHDGEVKLVKVVKE